MSSSEGEMISDIKNEVKTTKLQVEKRKKGRPTREDIVVDGETKQKYYPRLSVSQENIKEMMSKISKLENDLVEIKQSKIIPPKEVKEEKVAKEEEPEVIVIKKPKKKIIIEETSSDEEMKEYLKKKQEKEDKKRVLKTRKIVKQPKPKKIVEKYYGSSTTNTEREQSSDSDFEEFKKPTKKYQYQPTLNLF